MSLRRFSIKVQAGATVHWRGAFFLVEGGASSNVRVQGVTRQVGAFDGLKIVYTYKRGPNLQTFNRNCSRNLFWFFLYFNKTPFSVFSLIFKEEINILLFGVFMILGKWKTPGAIHTVVAICFGPQRNSYTKGCVKMSASQQ